MRVVHRLTATLEYELREHQVQIDDVRAAVPEVRVDRPIVRELTVPRLNRLEQLGARLRLAQIVLQMPADRHKPLGELLLRQSGAVNDQSYFIS